MFAYRRTRARLANRSLDSKIAGCLHARRPISKKLTAYTCAHTHTQGAARPSAPPPRPGPRRPCGDVPIRQDIPTRVAVPPAELAGMPDPCPGADPRPSGPQNGAQPFCGATRRRGKIDPCDERAGTGERARARCASRVRVGCAPAVDRTDRAAGDGPRQTEALYAP